MVSRSQAAAPSPVFKKDEATETAEVAVPPENMARYLESEHISKIAAKTETVAPLSDNVDAKRKSSQLPA